MPMIIWSSISFRVSEKVHGGMRANGLRKFTSLILLLSKSTAQCPGPYVSDGAHPANLLSGVTTVAHHNPFEPLFSSRHFQVRVVRKIAWAHSLDFSPDMVALRRDAPRGWPFVIHAAEGNDECARQELTKLDELGLLDDQAVLVHAAAATPEQMERLRACSANIVWCPSSNLFTLGRTLSADSLRTFPAVSLGTDSAMTAAGDLIDELHVARQLCGISATEGYRFVTSHPARALRLNSGEGAIRENGVADFLAVRDNGQTPAESLTSNLPDFVMKGGRTMLVSDRMQREREVPGTKQRMHWLDLDTRGRYLVRANIPRLFKAARRSWDPRSVWRESG